MKKRALLVFLAVVLMVSPLVFGACPPPAPPEPAPAPPAPPPPKPEVFKWKMQVFVPAGHPLAILAQGYFVDMVKKLSEGRLVIASHGAGEIVGPMEVGDAVSKGLIEMGTWWPGFDKGKDPIAAVLGGVPFAWTQANFTAWYWEFGGKELMQEFYDRFNIYVVGLVWDPAGAAMYWKKPIASLKDMKGLKVRAVGAHAEILKRADLGVGIVALPGGELYTAMETGVVDGVEFASPVMDAGLGLHEVAPYHQTPGWHEPVKPTLFIVNKDAWAKLPDDLKLIMKVAARDTYVHYNAKMMFDSAKAYEKILAKSKPLRLTDAELARLYDVTQAYLDELARKDAFSAKVIKSIRDYEALVAPVEHLFDFRFKRS